MEIRSTRPRGGGAYVAGALLIVIGLLALAGNLGAGWLTNQAIPMVIGLAFLVAYALTRKYGYLVPGGIVTGVGAGLLAAAAFGASDSGPYSVIGGGLGFLLIYALDFIVSGRGARWWPVIPGAFMVVLGSAMAVQNEGWVRQLGIWSPVLLIALGVWILLARGRTAGNRS